MDLVPGLAKGLTDVALNTAKGLVGTAKSVYVLQRAGLIGRPDDGVRRLAAVHRFGPLAGAVHIGARRSPHAVAIIDDLGPVTFEELDKRANALARAWAARGVKPGTVIAALCRDHRGMITTMAASGKVGAKLLLLNTGFAKPQLADVAKRENVKVLVHDEEFAGLLDAVSSDVDRYISWGEAANGYHIEQLISSTDDAGLPDPERPGSFVLLTSGTTGTPKGAPRDKTSALAIAQILDRIPVKIGQRMVLAAPSFHATGLNQMLIALALGNTVIMRRKFDPERTLADIAEHRASVVVLVPTMLQRILDLDSDVHAKYDTSSLEIVFAAGSAIPPDVVTRTLDAFGPVLYNLYGSTEVAVATVATPSELRKHPNTAGKAPVGCTVKLFDEHGKEVVEPGAIGRIFVSSGLAFSGYTDGRNKEIIDGMLSSGDVGHFDADGLLFVDGRDDDMIVSGGENVYPLEVENLIADRSDVVEAAVIGVPDEDFGQRLKAYVVLAPGAETDADDIRNYVKSNLARYKVPRDVAFLDELPRNATGKILRKKLAES